MSNLTLSLEADLLHKAREAAARDRTTVNALVRDFLTRYVDARSRRLQTIDAFNALAERSHSRSDDSGWTREHLHQRGI